MRKCKSFIRSLLLIVLLICASGNILFAQVRTISGTVTEAENGVAVPGANVTIKGTDGGTITDFDGKFTIKAQDGQTLIVSFVGMTSQEVLIQGQTTLDVALAAGEEIEEVIVVGYGTQKKIEVTGAVTSVGAKEMENIVASDFVKALQGQVAGVTITESSGRPGDNAYVNIRGLGSLNSSQEPLYVVDGIPYGSNPNIPAEEIESVSILKDGASAAIYGTRASNGVILITTRKGKAGQTKVSLSSYYGIQNITSATPLMNTNEQMYVEQRMAVQNGSFSLSPLGNPYMSDYNTDFVGAMLNNNAPIQAHNVSLSSGVGNVKFNLNANYYNQDGILINSGFDRFTTRANTSFEKNNFKAFVSMSYQQSKQEREPWGIYNYAQFQDPWRPPLADLETTENSIEVTGEPVLVQQFGYLAKQLSKTSFVYNKSSNIAGNFSYKIIEGLTLSENLGYGTSNRDTENWTPQLLLITSDGTIDSNSEEHATLQKENRTFGKWTAETILNYDKSFGNHNMKLTAAYSLEEATSSVQSLSKTNFISNNAMQYDAASDLVGISGSETITSRSGKIFRAQYNYSNMYLVSASIRHDGSSNFKEGNRYGTFPGFSLGWNVNEESFMKSLDFIDNFKIRASYAEVGNDRIGAYRFSTYIDPNVDYVYGRESNQTLGQGAVQRGFANEGIKWETNIARNLGFDLSFLQGRYSLNIDLYRNTKQDMLLDKLLPASVGTSAYVNGTLYSVNNKVTVNAGDMENKGVEIAASYNQKTSSGINFRVTGTFTKNINEVTSLGGEEKYVLEESTPTTMIPNDDPVTYMVLGRPAACFYLIPTNGIIKTEEELAYASTYMPAGTQIGDLWYIDSNNDGEINNEDRTYQGSAMPKFEAGLVLSADYKGLDFSVQLIYSYGGKVYNGAKMTAYALNRHKDSYYAWSDANPESDIARNVSTSSHMNYRSYSNYFLENGTYLRIRGLALGYTLPKKWLKNKIEKLRFYVRGQNPFTFTKYEGYDPEVGGNGLSTRGIDGGNYPVTRTFIGGVQIDF